MTDAQKRRTTEILTAWMESFPTREIFDMLRSEPLDDREKILGPSFRIADGTPQEDGTNKYISLCIRPTFQIFSLPEPEIKVEL
jgi:hypothetical protein